ncbi:MAG: hypothetical protein AB2L22_02670 [Syntrophales bacterium]
MKQIFLLLAALSLLGLFPGNAVPADGAIPDLRGNWTSCSAQKADRTGFTAVSPTFRMEIKDQSNRRFSGRLATNDQAAGWQKFQGTLDDQGRFLTILLSDRRVNVGLIISRNRLRLIFDGDPEDGMVAIHVLKREKPDHRAALDRHPQGPFQQSRVLQVRD